MSSLQIESQQQIKVDSTQVELKEFVWVSLQEHGQLMVGHTLKKSYFFNTFHILKGRLTPHEPFLPSVVEY